jgi:hypothetical protein
MACLIGQEILPLEMTLDYSKPMAPSGKSMEILGLWLAVFGHFSYKQRTLHLWRALSNIQDTKGTKGDPKATPALISKGKKNA